MDNLRKVTGEIIPKKILLIDDSQVDRDLSVMILEKHGYSVRVLENANSFIEIVESDMPDIILLDIMMPDVDGNELLTLLRKKWHSIELPVIMITSKSETGDVIESLKLGANDYITKPVEYDIALRRIQTHLDISALSKKMVKLKEMEALHAIITTYNHEINNPLTIAVSFSEMLHAQYPTEKCFEKIKSALVRIMDIVKKINKILERESVEYEKYSNSSNMLKLTKQDG